MTELLSRREVLRLAWPLILANTTGPLLGLSDTAVLGHSAGAVDLAAIALGTLIFNFLYWGFGFLRMTTTGFVAQASAAGDDIGAHAAFLRPLFVGILVGLTFVFARGLIISTGLSLFSAGQEEEALANAYFQARIWGAPASLSSLAAMGVLIGRGQSKKLLLIQIFVNGLNIGLDVLFVSVFDWGAEGVGWGTAIAEWCGALLAVAMVLRLLKPRFERELFSRVFEAESLRATLRANADVMIRTFAMILGFSYFTDQGARFGAATLAANHILLQFVSLSAFFLDGFAHVAEMLVGAAKGRRSLLQFDASVRRTSELAVFCALILGASVAVLGPLAVDLLTDIEEVRTLAKSWLPPVVAYVSVSVAAFQLDGIFIGTTSTRPLRNASLFSVVGFWLLSLALIPWSENEGLWWSFVGYVALRGASLSVLFLYLRRSLFSVTNEASSA